MAPKNPRGKDAGEANPKTDCVDEVPAPIVPDEPVPQLKSPQHAAVGALFRNEANLRQAITENLKPLRAESLAVDNRVQQAFAKFNPSTLSPEDLAGRHYVEPGADPSEVLKSVIMSGADALRSSNHGRAITLRDTPALRRLIREAPEPTDSLEGVVDLDPLINHIYRMSAGASLTTEPVFKRCKAELEAETILGAAEKPKNANGGNVANLEESPGTGTREAQLLVNESVNLQMKSATAPESRLEYAYIPNSAEKDKVQNAILQTFQLRPGASDVTSYHDFHTLQIAFAHVWTQIFDGQLTSLGRDLYSEYVKLKDFSGSNDQDLQISTLNDLRRLMDEIRKLSQFVQDDIPGSLRPEGGGQKNNNWISVTPEDVTRGAGAVATGGVSLFIEWAINELIKLGNNPVKVTWNSFPLKLNEPRGNIVELFSPEQNAVYPGNVEIVLETDSNSFKKQIVFQQWDSDTQRPIYNAEIQNFGPGHGSERSPSGTIIDRLLLNASQIASGTLKFVSEDEQVNQLLLGRYVLGDLTEVLKPRTRVTFRWKGQR